MKKLISLLGAFGLLVTTSSSVISCTQETKSSQDQHPEPTPKKTQLSEVLTQTNLNTIHVESTPKPSRSELADEKLEITFNLSRYIINRLLELNNNNEQTGINPFELYVDIPTLINHYGDMRTIVEVIDTSKTHTGHIEVTFNIDIDSKFIITQSHLGNFYATDETKFELIDGVPIIKDEFLFAEIFRLNPKLADPRFEGKLKKKLSTFRWNEDYQTGQVEVILEGYQSSLFIAYTAYTKVQELIRNTNLGFFLTEGDFTTTKALFINQLYLNNPNMFWIEPENINFKYFPEFGRVIVQINNLEGKVAINFKHYFYPNEWNVNTYLGTIPKPGRDDHPNPKELYRLWRSLNMHLDPEFLMADWNIYVADLLDAFLYVFYKGTELRYKLSYFIDEE